MRVSVEQGPHDRIPRIIVEQEHLPVGFVYRDYPIYDPMEWLAEEPVVVYVGRNPEGFVRYYCHDPRNERGFGGDTLNLPMEDGTTRTIRGPWSSNATVVNELLEEPVIAITLRTGSCDVHGFALPIATLRDAHSVTFIRDTTESEAGTYTPELP